MRPQDTGIGLVFLKDMLVGKRLMSVQLHKLIVLDRQIFLETFSELFRLDEVAHANADAVHLVHVARPDAALCRADLARTARFLRQPIHQAMVRHDDVRPV